MANGNHICLTCLKAKKSPNLCCGYEPLYIGTKARTPKLTDSKQDWKKFISLFVIHSTVAKQQKRIIHIRKTYGLPVIEQEARLKLLEAEHEEKFGILDIKRHLTFEVSDYGKDSNLYSKDIKNMKTVVDYFRKTLHHDKKHYKNEIEYFVVPIHSEVYGHYMFPIESGKFEIIKARAMKSTIINKTFDLMVKTENGKVMLDPGIYKYRSNRYAYAQDYLVFDDRIKALAFRSEYLQAIFPILKKNNVNYLDEIVKTVNISVDRVIKKAPELLI